MKNIKVSEISKQSVGKWEFILQILGIKMPEGESMAPARNVEVKIVSVLIIKMAAERGSVIIVAVVMVLIL